ncbi:MAG: dihydropteroate synthase [Planctomycetaceae bacterium]|nr:dihydropteroate synthase [Planctomycetaceae bacterium]
MGILNVTPDSFSDGGAHATLEASVAHAIKLIADGADLLDIGGESTRPGAEPVSAEDELRRVIPVIRELAGSVAVPLSIDTTKARVAAAALEAGATIVNDVSGLTLDADMPSVCRDHEAGVICMHAQGTPQMMQIDPHYDDVVGEIETYFRERLAALSGAGIPPERIVLDPGIGFGKTARHNLDLLAASDRLRALGRPLLIGHSRKRFLKAVLGRPVEERTAGTIGVSIALASLGVDYLRVHDVSAVRDALVAWQSVIEGAGDGASGGVGDKSP